MEIVHGGVKVYRGSAAAARNYVEADRSRADDYYLAEGTGLAQHLTVHADGRVVELAALSGDGYEAWVAGADPDTTMNPHRNHDDDDNVDREQDNDRHDHADERDDHAEAGELFTLAEVARLLRVSPATVRYWRHQQTGPRSFRIGRHVRYRRRDVLNWIARQIDGGSDDAA